MKLDKIKFARLVAFLSRNGFDGFEDNIQALDDMIDIDVSAQEKLYVSAELVDELLRQMALGNKIPAIKAYRELCNAGLKESKDAVEGYWVAKSNFDVDNFGVRNVNN